MSRFEIASRDLRRVGSGLARPENVLAFRDGTVFTSSNRGYITRLHPDGSQDKLGNIPEGQPTSMAIDGDGSVLTNNTADGKLYRIHRDGSHEIVLDSIDGESIGSVNYVLRDSVGRVWLAVATRRLPPHRELNVTAADGYIALMDEQGIRIVADGIRWPNEIKLDADEAYAYVPETLGRRVLRYRVRPNGDLIGKEVIGPDPLAPAGLPDGLTLDAQGNAWVALPALSKVVVITPDGEVHTVFADPDPPDVSPLIKSYEDGAVPMSVFAACAGRTVKLPTSIAFGGDDLTTAYIGSLAMPHLLSFTSPVPGLPLRHHREY